MDEDADATERSAQTLLLKFRKVAKSFEFQVLIGAVALTVGVVITAVTFQDHQDGSFLFLIGPAFIATGIFVMGRSVLFRLMRLGLHSSEGCRRRHRSGTRQDDYTGHTRTEDNTPADVHYGDFPPPYETAIATSSPNIASSQVTLSTMLGDDGFIAPPSYEEAIRHPSVIVPGTTAASAEPR